jgi:hypothetical protein
MYLNTKQDYLNINDDSEYQKLLDGEYRWQDTGPVAGVGTVDTTHKVVRSESMGVKSINQWQWTPDPVCRMYELGFTRDEILALSGLVDPGNSPKEWTPYEPPELSWADIKAQREVLFGKHERKLDAWRLTTYTEREAVLAYIQLLRDIPQTYATPDDVIWPTEPE